MNIYNLYSTEAQFKNYLAAGKISAVSVRNYLSDFRYFCGWIQKTVGNDNLNNFIRERAKVFEEYLAYLHTSASPVKTQKRRLSTLRKYYDFLIYEKLIDGLSPDTGAETSSFLLMEASSEDYSNLLSSFKYELLSKEAPTEAEKVVNNVNELLSFIQSN